VLLLVLLTLLAVLLLARLPWWLSALLLAGGLLFAGSVTSLSGLERAAGIAVATLLLLGLAVPLGDYAQRRSRVAPRKRKAKAADAKRGEAASASADAVDIPGYEVLEKVGSGGMASVYRARRTSDGQIVALKIPMEQYVADAKFIRRFHREAEVAQRLDHMNIVRTFEHGAIGAKHYMVMEYVDGKSLESYIEDGELDLSLSIEIMKLVVQALMHIHSAGIIHRDIKPANIMILHGGVREGGEYRLEPDAVKLMDFGIAGGKILSKLTMTGARVGTPVYMSPEQARGLKIDHRSDIYSLGLVFYEMLTGQTAFKGGYEAIVHQQIFQTPPPPRQLNLQIPKALDNLVMRMIAKEADERPRLEDVLETLRAGDFQDARLDELASRLVVTVSARQGVVRILDPDGNLHATFGEIGVGEGRFSGAPLSVAVDSQGYLYASVFEYRLGKESHRMIHKLDPEGKVVLSFGPYGMKPGEFLYPIAVAVAPDDSVYILDSEAHQVQQFDSAGRYLRHFGGRGEGRGKFNDPRALSVGPDGSVYVLDYGNHQIQCFDASGVYQMRWAFKLGAEQPGMRVLDGLTVDQRGALYVSDATGGKIRKLGAQGKVELSYALEPLQGEATDALLDLGVDDAGYLYAARRGGHLIRKFDPAGKLVATIETYVPIVQLLVDIRPEVAKAQVPVAQHLLFD
jgi:serine/threonine protein kinase/sugar lactone lactonase YvrE